jgi:hypothetical protein
MKQMKITREHLEHAAKQAAQHLHDARRRFEAARVELDEALQNAAVSAERLRFSEAIGGPAPKPPKEQKQDAQSI